jgi:hypothetical protein
MKLVNPFDCPGNWYRANLHSHTTCSDGELTVAQRVAQYRGAGYDILALTDHRVTIDVTGLSDESFLVIGGIEAHPLFPDPHNPWGICAYHLVCLNVPHGLELPHDEQEVDRCVDLVKQAGGLVILAHPNLTGHDLHEMLAVKDFIAIEVFNKASDRHGKAISSVHWDDLLSRGHIVGGLASDDTHIETDAFAGWTTIRAAELTLEAVMDSLAKGCYYASCGPVIEDFRVEEGVAKIKCSPAKEIRLIGQRWFGKSFYAEDGAFLTEQQWTVHEEVRYLRGEVIDDKGRCAWTNPIVLIE